MINKNDDFDDIDDFFFIDPNKLDKEYTFKHEIHGTVWAVYHSGRIWCCEGDLANLLKMNSYPENPKGIKQYNIIYDTFLVDVQYISDMVTWANSSHAKQIKEWIDVEIEHAKKDYNDTYMARKVSLLENYCCTFLKENKKLIKKIVKQEKVIKKLNQKWIDKNN